MIRKKLVLPTSSDGLETETHNKLIVTQNNWVTCSEGKGQDAKRMTTKKIRTQTGGPDDLPWGNYQSHREREPSEYRKRRKGIADRRRLRSGMLSRVWLFATPWSVACQAPLSVEFPGKNTGVGCHFLLQGNLPYQGIEHASPALAGGFFNWVTWDHMCKYSLWGIECGKSNDLNRKQIGKW